MSARIPPGFCELVHHFDAPGQSGDIITSVGAGGTLFNDTDAQNEYIVAADELLGNLNNHVTGTTIDFVLGQDGPDDVVISRAWGSPGVAGGNMTPINSAFLLQKRTATGGRRGRGRMYLPGVGEGAVGDDGTLDAGVAAGIQTNVDNWLGAWPGDWVPMLLHQVAPFTPSQITVISVSPKVATQRTRLRD